MKNPFDLYIQVQCLNVLVSNGANLDLGDYAGDTPNRIAEIYGKEECVQFTAEHMSKRPRTSDRVRHKGSPKARPGVRKGQRSPGGSTSPRTINPKIIISQPKS